MGTRVPGLTLEDWSGSSQSAGYAPGRQAWLATSSWTEKGERFDPQGRGDMPSIFKNKTLFGAEGGVKGHRATVRQSIQLRDLAQGEHSHVASTQTKTQHRAEDTGTGW